MTNTAQKEASELWFEKYLREQGLNGADDHHPDLGTARKPDYRVSRGDRSAICEVKEFGDSKLDRRFRKAAEIGQRSFVTSPDEQYGSVRRAISRGAEQLKGLQERHEALAVVLANPAGVSVDLEHPMDLIAAMYGNEGVSVAINTPTGQSAPDEVIFDRDGALTAKHRYISAVITLHQRRNSQDALEAWAKANRHRWVDIDDRREALHIAQEAHQEPDYLAAKRTPGHYCFVRVYSTMSTVTGDAVPVPKDLFAGPHDEYWEAQGGLERGVQLVRVRP